jgi:hypothetical protein
LEGRLIKVRVYSSHFRGPFEQYALLPKLKNIVPVQIPQSTLAMQAHQKPARRAQDPVKFGQPLKLMLLIKVSENRDSINAIEGGIRKRQGRSLAVNAKSGAEVGLAPLDGLGVYVRTVKTSVRKTSGEPADGPAAAAAKVENVGHVRQGDTGAVERTLDACGNFLTDIQK